MTKWYNFGVSVSDASVVSEIVDELEEAGLGIYASKDRKVKATENARRVESETILNALESYGSAVNSVIVVTANDNADTASARVFEMQDGQLEQVDSEHSGSTDSRYNWHGVTKDGVRVNGGKYY